MTNFAIKSADACRWDCVSLGEVMLRLDPGEGRIHTTRHFTVWEGGGEYNVARGLRRCFGLHGAIVTALAENPVGRLVEDLILQVESILRCCGGCRMTAWAARCAMGSTLRSAGLGCARRLDVRTAETRRLRTVKPRGFDFGSIFGTRGKGLESKGTRWLQTGRNFCGAFGIDARRSRNEAMDAARKYGTLGLVTI